MNHDNLPPPSLRIGWQIFVSRSLSLIVAFIVAVVLCIVSFFLLFFPVVAGYYHAVRHSRREEYFIDIPNVSRTISLLFKGIRLHFWQSYVFGLAGWLPVALLFLAPVLPVVVSPREGLALGLILQIVWIPAFFLAGAVIFLGYPHFIATNRGKASIRYAIATAKTDPLSAVGRGFILLFPVPAVVFHVLMVFSYPILAAWAVASSEDETAAATQARPGAAPAEIGMKKILFALLLAGGMFGTVYGLAWLAGGAGFFIGLGLCFVLAFLFRKKIAR